MAAWVTAWSKVPLLARVLVSASVALLVSGVVMLAVSIRQDGMRLNSALSEGLAADLRTYPAVLAEVAVLGDLATLNQILETFTRDVCLKRALYKDAEGTVLIAEGKSEYSTAPPWFAGILDVPDVSGTVDITVGSRTYGALTLVHTAAHDVYFAWRQVWDRLAVLLLAIGLNCAGIWLVVRNDLAALKGLESGAVLLGEGNLNVHLTPGGAPEVRSLTESFNRMAQILAHERSARDAIDAELRRSEERYRVMVESAREGIWTTDKEFRIVFANEAMRRMLGCAKVEDLLGTSLTEFVGDEERITLDRQRFARLWGKSSRYEMKLLTADKEELWVIISSAPILDPNGTFVGSVGLMTDITIQKRAEDCIEDLAQFPLENPNPVLKLSFEGEVLSANPASREFLTLFGEDGGARLARGWTARLMEESSALKASCEFIHGARTFTVTYAKSPSKKNMRLYGYDITERARLESDLRQARQAAQNANMAKSIFLANMSHEIRTPLNGIIGIFNLCEQESVESERRKLLRVGLESSHRLLKILNDILDVSRIEAGKMSLTCERVEFKSLLNSVNVLFTEQFVLSKINYTWSVSDDLPVSLFGDGAKTRQILLNLVGNAVKFTTNGGLHVDVMLTRKNQPDKTAWVLLTVADQGCGMAQDELNTLFKPFIQVENSYTRKFGGAGLGLSIVAKLVSLMGGTVCVESEREQGACFYVALPYAYNDDLPAEVVPQRCLEDNCDLKAKVLLVEDEMVNQIVVSKLLKKLDYDFVVAANGFQAIEQLQREPFDLVLMDIQMPEMNGMEATEAIRNSGLPYAGVPIIALTAHAMAGDRDKFLAAGMDDYVSKPVDMQNLRNVILSVISRSGASACHLGSGPVPGA